MLKRLFLAGALAAEARSLSRSVAQSALTIRPGTVNTRAKPMRS